MNDEDFDVLLHQHPMCRCVVTTDASFKLGGYIRVKDLEALLKLPDQSCRWGLRAWVKDIGKFYIFKPVRDRLVKGDVVRGSWVRDTSR